MVVVPVGLFLASLEWGGRVPSQLIGAASVLALTPVGAAWSFPALVAVGDAAAWGSLAVAVATVCALGAAWMWLVERVLTTACSVAGTSPRENTRWRCSTSCC